MEKVEAFAITLAQLIIGFLIFFTYIKKYLKKYFSKPDVSSLIPKQNEIDLRLMKKMEYAKEMLNADRIHIYEFHNGSHYADYRSAYKFSCSYEVTRAGTPSYRNQCIGLPISVMPKFVNKITAEGDFKCNDIERLKDIMPGTYHFKKSINLKAFYDIALKDSAGRVIGFVAIHWDEGTTPVWNEEIIRKLVWGLEEDLQEAIDLNKKNH